MLKKFVPFAIAFALCVCAFIAVFALAISPSAGKRATALRPLQRGERMVLDPGNQQAIFVGTTNGLITVAVEHRLGGVMVISVDPILVRRASDK